MEFLTIFVSSLLTLVSPVGLVVDHTAENAIRSQFKKVEQLQVRVDNPPSYQLLRGKVERVRIAARGLQPKQQDIRIAALELETDPIDLNLSSLRQRQPKLNRPLSGGVRLVLTEQDINQALKSPKLTERLRKLGINLVNKSSNDALESYTFVNPRVEFLENNRLRFHVELQGKDNVQSLTITVEFGLTVVKGRQIQLIKPLISVNGEKAPNEIVSAIATNFSQQLDLDNLQQYGVQARLLKLNISQDEFEIAAFLRIEPSSRLLENRRSSM